MLKSVTQIKQNRLCRTWKTFQYIGFYDSEVETQIIIGTNEESNLYVKPNDKLLKINSMLLLPLKYC